MQGSKLNFSKLHFGNHQYCKMVAIKNIWSRHVSGSYKTVCLHLIFDNSTRVYKFFAFSFLFFFLKTCQSPIGHFCWNFSCQIYFSLAMETKTVVTWSSVMTPCGSGLVPYKLTKLYFWQGTLLLATSWSNHFNHSA